MTKLKTASLIRPVLVIIITLTLAYEFQNVRVQGGSDVPITAVPAGYGRYCSVRYPGGVWSFATLTAANSDPCSALLKSKPGGTIERAGLWATPKHIDPWAWKFLGYQDDANSLKDPGAFSINLWRTGEAPPSVW